MNKKIEEITTVINQIEQIESRLYYTNYSEAEADYCLKKIGSLYQTLLEDIEKHTKEENSTRFTPTEENFTALSKSLSEVPEFKEILKDDMTVAEYSLFLEDVMKYCKYQLNNGAEQKETSFNEFVHTMDSMQEEEHNKKAQRRR